MNALFTDDEGQSCIVSMPVFEGAGKGVLDFGM